MANFKEQKLSMVGPKIQYPTGQRKYEDQQRKGEAADVQSFPFVSTWDKTPDFLATYL